MALIPPRSRRLCWTHVGLGPTLGTLRERREALIGATESGRILHVVYTMRGEKVRPITARAADETEKGRYRRGRR
jgi:uncharacterized DUF497 family protein